MLILSSLQGKQLLTTLDLQSSTIPVCVGVGVARTTAELVIELLPVCDPDTAEVSAVVEANKPVVTLLAASSTQTYVLASRLQSRAVASSCGFHATKSRMDSPRESTMVSQVSSALTNQVLVQSVDREAEEVVAVE